MAAATKCLLQICQMKLEENWQTRSSILSVINAKGKNNMCFVHPPHQIEVILNNKLKGLIKSAQRIQAVCIHAEGRHGFATVALDDKGLYSVNLSVRRSKVIPTEENKACHPGTEVMSTSDNIFSELLGEGEGQTHNRQGIKVNPELSTDTVIHIREDHKLLTATEDIESVLVIGDVYIILTAAKSNVGWKVSFYSAKEGLQDAFQQYYIPRSSALNVEETSSSSDEAFSSQTKAKPQLYCVLPSSYNAQQSNISYEDGRVFDRDHVWPCLDITDNLLDTPVVLVLLPSGQLYQCPLSKQPKHRVGSPYLQYDLLQDALSLHAVHFDPRIANNNQDNLQAKSDSKHFLVLVSRHGKLVLMSKGKTHTEYGEIQLLGPVIAAIVHQHSLIYSTGRDLHWLDLTPLLLTDAAAGSGVTRVPAQPKSCGYSNVVCLAAVHHKVTTDSRWITAHKAELLAVTRKGHMVLLEIDYDTPPNLDCARPVLSGGQRLKDLVTGIGRVAHQMEDVQGATSAQQLVLNQLAIASVLAAESNGTTGKITASQCTTVRCNIELHTEDLGWQVQHEVRVTVENSTSFCLSRGWCLLVSIQSCLPHTDRDAETTRNLQGLSVTKSLSLGTLASGMSKTLVLSLPAYFHTSLPVLVTPMLHFSVKSCMKSMNHEPGKDLCVSIPMTCKKLTILSFLTPLQQSKAVASFAANIRDTTNTTPSSITEVIERLAQARRPHLMCTQQQSVETGQRESVMADLRGYSTSVALNKSQVEAMSASDRTHPETAILQHFLRDNPSCRQKITTASVRLGSPCGHQVSLSVHKSSGADNLAITVHTSNMATLAQLRMAVTEVVQSLASPPVSQGVPVMELRKVLRKLEDVQTELVCLQDTIVEQGATEASGDNTRRLYGLYEALRSIHLSA